MKVLRELAADFTAERDAMINTINEARGADNWRERLAGYRSVGDINKEAAASVQGLKKGADLRRDDEGDTPPHYRMKISPVEYIVANNLGFVEGNIIKYISRYKNKGGVDDLHKARVYLDYLINDF